MFHRAARAQPALQFKQSSGQHLALVDFTGNAMGFPYMGGSLVIILIFHGIFPEKKQTIHTCFFFHDEVESLR